MTEKLKIGATVVVEKRNKKGEITDTRTVHNLVVDTGFDLVSDLLAKVSDRPAPLGYVGMGTGTTESATTMTGLVSEWGTRVATTYSHTAGTSTFTLMCVIPEHSSGGAINLTESGIFNASTGGTMFNRVTFAAIGKEQADTITVRYIINLVDQ